MGRLLLFTEKFFKNPNSEPPVFDKILIGFCLIAAREHGISTWEILIVMRTTCA